MSSSVTEPVAMLEAQIRRSGGKLVSYRDQTTWGHDDVTDAVELDAEGGFGVVAPGRILVIAAGALAGLEQGAAITVGGEPAVVLRWERVRGGPELQVFLGEPR